MANAVAPLNRRIGHPLALFAVSLGLGLAAALALGSLAGLLTYGSMAADCNADGWCELGAALIGLAIGVVIGYAAYIVAGVAAIFRWREPGRRWRPTTTHVVTPPAFALFWFIASGLGL